MFYFMFVIILILIILYVSTSMKLDFAKDRQEYEKELNEDAENIKKFVEKIEEEQKSTVQKIMIPDETDIKKSTTKSTQDMDCKEYTITTNNKPEKTVIGENKEKVFNDLNTNNNDNEDENDPIKHL